MCGRVRARTITANALAFFAGLATSAACALLPSTARAMVPSCPALSPPPPPALARVIGNASTAGNGTNASASLVTAFAGPNLSSNTWVAALRAVASAATPLAQADAAVQAAGSVVTLQNITVFTPGA